MRPLSRFLAAHSEIVAVRLNRVDGSAPREAGAKMFVSRDAMCGTIGGGQLEYMAIDEARKLIARKGGEAQMTLPLGPEIGQCCGGRVALSLRRMSEADRTAAVGWQNRR